MALKINCFSPTLAISILSSLSNLRAEPLSGGSICPSVIFSVASHAQRTLKTTPTDVSALWHIRLPFGRYQEEGTETHGLIGVGGHDLLCHRNLSGSLGLFFRYGLLDLTTHYQPIFFMENLNLKLLRGGLEQVEVKAKYRPDFAWFPVISLRPFALRKGPKYNMGMGWAFDLSKYIQFGGGVQLHVPLAFEAPKRVNLYLGLAVKESQSQPSLWMIRSLTTQIDIVNGSGVQDPAKALLEAQLNNILKAHTGNQVSLKDSLRDFLFEAYSTNGATNFQAMIELGVALDDQFFEALKLLPEGDLDSLLSDAAPKPNQSRPPLEVKLGSVWNLLSSNVVSAYLLELAKLKGKDNPEVAALLAKEYTPEVAALLAAADRTIYDLFLCLPDQAQREYFCAKLPSAPEQCLATLLPFFSDKALIDKITNNLLPKLFNNPQGHDVGRGKFYPQLQVLFDRSTIIPNLPEELSKYKKQHKEVLKRYVEILKPILKDNPKAVGDLDTKWKEYEKLNP